jgi:hypothetical protein
LTKPEALDVAAVFRRARAVGYQIDKNRWAQAAGQYGLSSEADEETVRAHFNNDVEFLADDFWREADFALDSLCQNLKLNLADIEFNYSSGQDSANESLEDMEFSIRVWIPFECQTISYRTSKGSGLGNQKPSVVYARIPGATRLDGLDWGQSACWLYSAVHGVVVRNSTDLKAEIISRHPVFIALRRVADFESLERDLASEVKSVRKKAVLEAVDGAIAYVEEAVDELSSYVADDAKNWRHLEGLVDGMIRQWIPSGQHKQAVLTAESEGTRSDPLAKLEPADRKLVGLIKNRRVHPTLRDRLLYAGEVLAGGLAGLLIVGASPVGAVAAAVDVTDLALGATALAAGISDREKQQELRRLAVLDQQIGTRSGDDGLALEAVLVFVGVLGIVGQLAKRGARAVRTIRPAAKTVPRPKPLPETSLSARSISPAEKSVIDNGVASSPPAYARLESGSLVDGVVRKSTKVLEPAERLGDAERALAGGNRGLPQGAIERRAKGESNYKPNPSRGYVSWQEGVSREMAFAESTADLEALDLPAWRVRLPKTSVVRKVVGNSKFFPIVDYIIGYWQTGPIVSSGLRCGKPEQLRKLKDLFGYRTKTFDDAVDVLVQRRVLTSPNPKWELFERAIFDTNNPDRLKEYLESWVRDNRYDWRKISPRFAEYADWLKSQGKNDSDILGFLLERIVELDSRVTAIPKVD